MGNYLANAEKNFAIDLVGFMPQWWRQGIDILKMTENSGTLPRTSKLRWE